MHPNPGFVCDEFGFSTEESEKKDFNFHSSLSLSLCTHHERRHVSSWTTHFHHSGSPGKYIARNLARSGGAETKILHKIKPINKPLSLSHTHTQCRNLSKQRPLNLKNNLNYNYTGDIFSYNLVILQFFITILRFVSLKISGEWTQQHFG